eukprot:COSAG02_NODE_23726_length_710_cov_0.833061_1_plen_110_part_10
MSLAAFQLRGVARPERLLWMVRVVAPDAGGPLRNASTVTSVIDWSQKGPDWKQRGRSQEEMYVARMESELLRKRREDRAKSAHEMATPSSARHSLATDFDPLKPIVAAPA